jgi:asparagine synthase (glutamine-hydrolysing)
MCGLAGFVDFRKQTTPEQLAAMTDALAHRGPDASDYRILSAPEGDVGLGHRRLSIIDLSPLGRQPMFSRDGRYTIVFNGEVYNYADIRKDLEGLGHVFISRTDTEVVLNAYIRWGISAVSRFLGMFAFVIYDSVHREVVACRDRAGVKPFFYAHSDGSFLFASELKALHHHPRFSKDLDIEGLAAFLRYGYIPAPRSIFRETRKLPPGHILILNLQSRQLRVEPYWDVFDAFNAPKLDLSEDEAVERFEDLFRSAFAYRMVSDVPVGLFLSGGYDSSLVAALLQRHRGERLRTFTIGFHDHAFNEAPWARRVAGYLGTEHTEHCCTTKEAQDIIRQLPDIYDEPFGDSSSIPTILLSRVARNSVKVALSADGGDEIFGGYPRYLRCRRWFARLQRVPRCLRTALARGAEVGSRCLSHLPGGKSPASFLCFGAAMLRCRDGAELLGEYVGLGSMSELSRLLRCRLGSPRTPFGQLQRLSPDNDDLARMTAAEYAMYLPDDILAKVDRATMSVGLEGREPLLDHRIIELAARLSSGLKIHGGTGKYLVRRLVHRYLPRAVMDRPKQGFAIPLVSWLRGELRGYVDRYLDAGRIRRAGVFHAETIRDWTTAFFEGTRYRGLETRIWHLLTFEMWRERWLGA